MHMPAAFFPEWFLWLSSGLALLGLGAAAWRTDWRRQPVHALNGWLGAVVLMMLLWLLNGGVRTGQTYHLLGATVLTLMMGPWLALQALAVVMAGVAWAGLGDWAALGVNWLTMALMPVTVSSVFLRAAQRWLPAHFFIYIFVNAFLAGGASLFAAGLAGVLVMGGFGAYPWDELFAETLPYYFLLSWSEAFTSGLMMAVLTVYRPAWVASFDDSRYLNDKPAGRR